jgi:dTDP-glucose pyrophosphorylase
MMINIQVLRLNKLMNQSVSNPPEKSLLNIVVPMAGHGSRFATAGYLDPKPLIPVLGKPMISWVIQNLRPTQTHRFIFICQADHIQNYPLRQLLEKEAPECIIIEVGEVTQGAACTVLLAKQYINNDNPLMIANCDQFIDVNINDYLAAMRPEVDGLIMTMSERDPKWSYVGFNERGQISRVVEKEVVSDEATVGIYNYQHGGDFVRAAQHMIDQNLRVNNEFYVAPAYNEMIAAGKNIVHFNVGCVGEGMHGLGTPQDLEQFMNIQKYSLNLHLFFDVFIEDAPLGIYFRGDRKRFDEDYKIRSVANAYKFQTKLDITRYSLASYQAVPWASQTIRIVCEKPEFEGVYDEAKALFPNGNIQKTRSDTSQKYFKALSELDLDDDAWIFFCPNNDHPWINNLEYLSEVVKDANEAIEKLNPELITIGYSHFTESQNCFSPFQHEWGAYGNVYPKMLYETAHSYIVELNKLLIDSVHIARLGDLKWIFGDSKKEGRVIRQEDTEFYLTDAKKQIVVIPKYEFCRHYDGYMHVADKVPPLFIPDGFFESNIKIRYGYDEIKAGYVNINPLADKFSYQSLGGSDLKIVLADIPKFWHPRVSEWDVNPDFPKEIDRGLLPYYLDLVNPWRKSWVVHNLLRSYRSYLRYRWKRWRGKVS